MAPRGKTPSLIGGGAGHTKFVVARRLRHCRRCGGNIPGGSGCAQVSVPGTLNSKTYCMDCYKNILDQTKNDLAALESEANGL